nr:zinc finger protein 287 [Nothobranchius furzeri]
MRCSILAPSCINEDEQLMELVVGEPWCGVDQQDPENLHIMEEQKEVSTSLEGKQLDLKETDAARLPCTAVSIKSKDDEEKSLHQHKIEDKEDLNHNEQTFKSSDIEVSGDDEEDDDVNLNSKVLVCKHETGDEDNDWNDGRASTSSCDDRGKGSTLNNHIRVHEGQKPLICKICEQQFSHKSQLNSHMKIYMRQKHFACNICDQSFISKRNLKKHEEVHIGQNPLACKICKQTFSHKSHLTHHMRVHTDRDLLPVSSVDRDLASRHYTQTSCLTKGVVGGKLEESWLEPLKRTVYILVEPCNTSAEMGKKTNKTTQVSGEPKEDETSQGNRTSQTRAANIPVTFEQLVKLVKDEPWCGVDQQDPENLHIKEEQKEVGISMEGEQLTDAARLPFTAASIKSEDEEKPVFSQLHQQQIEHRDVPMSSSAHQVTAETSMNSDLNPHKRTFKSSDTEFSGCDEDDNYLHFGCELCGQRFCKKVFLTHHMRVHTDRDLLPVSSVDRDLASRRYTQTSCLTKGVVGGKLEEFWLEPSNRTVYILVEPCNTSAEMGKKTNKTTQVSGEPKEDETSQGNRTSQTRAANIPVTFEQLVKLVKDEPWCGVDQQHPENLHIKEEQKEVSISMEGEQLTDAARLPFTAACIKSEDEPLLSQLHHLKTRQKCPNEQLS